MKIGIDGRAAKWYRGTGIGTYTYQLISSLSKVDKKNDYLLFMPESCNSDIRLDKNFQVRSITENNQSSFWDEVNIPNILKDKDIELYHVPQNGVGLPEAKDCPFIITLHDVIPYKMPETVGENYLRIFSEEMPKIVSRCDGIITVSNFSKDDIAEAFNFPKEKIFVTYLAAEDIYRPLDKAECSQLIKSHYSIEGDYILYIGGFSPRKNITGLIEAFSKLKEVYKKDLKLVIAGKKGKSYSIYKQRAEDLNIADSVIFPGFIPLEHLPELYNAAKLFVYPSFYEGFGLPPIEAMACGVPVIASNVTSVPEIIKDCALFIDPHNVDNICEAMYSALLDCDLRQRLILSGLTRSSELTWSNTAANTLIAYSKTINNL